MCRPEILPLAYWLLIMTVFCVNSCKNNRNAKVKKSYWAYFHSTKLRMLPTEHSVHKCRPYKLRVKCKTSILVCATMATTTTATMMLMGIQHKVWCIHNLSLLLLLLFHFNRFLCPSLTADLFSFYFFFVFFFFFSATVSCFKFQLYFKCDFELFEHKMFAKTFVTCLQLLFLSLSLLSSCYCCCCWWCYCLGKK